MSEDAIAYEPALPSRKGRPAKSHDNARVREVLSAWSVCEGSVAEDVADGCGDRWLSDILTGVSWLQTHGQQSTRPLNSSLILRVLVHCDSITSEAVGRCIGRGLKRAQVDRYTAATRVASKAIEAELDRRPQWVRQVLDDAAYFAELDVML